MIERIQLSLWVKYRLNGEDHRPNGPTTEFIDGDWDWYRFGERHRYYGPARNYGNYKWFIHGNSIKR
jgi:hypothetical protein